MVTTAVTTYKTAEGEAATFSEIDLGAILSVTGTDIGAGRLRATQVVLIA